MPVRGWLGPFQMIVAITDPDDVQLVLSDYKVADKAYVYKFFKNDHGLLSSQRAWNIVFPRIIMLYFTIAHHPNHLTHLLQIKYGKSTGKSLIPRSPSITFGPIWFLCSKQKRTSCWRDWKWLTMALTVSWCTLLSSAWWRLVWVCRYVQFENTWCNSTSFVYQIITP